MNLTAAENDFGHDEASDDARYDDMSLAQVTQRAQDAVTGSCDAVFVMHVPSGLIIASSFTASMVLDPIGKGIVGHRVVDFTADEPGALALFAAGRISGYGVDRSLARPDEADLHVSFWHKSFDHHSASRFALVLITADPPAEAELAGRTPDTVPVIGTVSTSNLIEQISSGTVELFGEPPNRLLGLPVSDLFDAADGERWRAAVEAASAGEHAVTVVVRVRRTGNMLTAAAEPVMCDVVLLPLRPGFTFILLPVTRGASRQLDGGVRSLFSGLSQVAGLAHLDQQASAGLTEQDLPGFAELTPRERDMLTRLISGYRVSSIAEDLVLSPSTVRTHLASTFAKLGVANQGALLDAVRSTRPQLLRTERYPPVA